MRCKNVMQSKNTSIELYKIILNTYLIGIKCNSSIKGSLKSKISVCNAVFCGFLKVLIISNSKIVKTSSELISTRSELISTSSELISTIGE